MRGTADKRKEQEYHRPYKKKKLEFKLEFRIQEGYCSAVDWNTNEHLLHRLLVWLAPAEPS
jgi:hypothetical protein